MLGFFITRDGATKVGVARAEPTDLSALAGGLVPGQTLDSVPYFTAEPIYYRLRSSTPLHLGPDEKYAVVGLLPRGAEVDVTGRDQTGRWLAVSFGALNGWLPASMLPQVDVTRLRPAPVTLPR